MSQARLCHALFAEIARGLPEWDLFEADRALERVLGGLVWRLRLSTHEDASGLKVVPRIEVEHRRRGDAFCTIGTDLGSLAGGRYVWQAASDRDACAVAGAILALIEGPGQRFLDRYSTVPEVLRALRTDPHGARLIKGTRAAVQREAARIEARWEGRATDRAPAARGKSGTDDG